MEYLQEHRDANRIRLVSCHPSGDVTFIRCPSSILVDRRGSRAEIPPFVRGRTRELEASQSTDPSLIVQSS
jgi:hypothetical protein